MGKTDVNNEVPQHAAMAASKVGRYQYICIVQRAERILPASALGCGAYRPLRHSIEARAQNSVMLSDEGRVRRATRRNSTEMIPGGPAHHGVADESLSMYQFGLPPRSRKTVGW